MNDAVILRPRCPQCGRVQAEWIEGRAKFICPRCHVTFVIGDLDFLTELAISAKVKDSKP